MHPIKLLALALLAPWMSSVTAQVQWQWARSGAGRAYDQSSAVTTDPSGNVIVVGYFASDSIAFDGQWLFNDTPGFDDFFVVKYDPAGTVLWARSAGGNFDDKAYAVATDAAGNIHVAANFYSATITIGTTTLTNAGNVGDICRVTYDPAGNVLAAIREGGPGLEIPYAIAVDDAGNTIMAGRFSSNSVTFGTTTLLQAGSMDVFVVKHDAAGSVIWAVGAGGGTNDEAYAVAVDTNGDIIVAGYYTQTATFGTVQLPDPGQANIFLAKCDGTTGTFLWARGTATSGDERALAIDLDAADDIYMAGYFQGDSLVIGSTTLHATSFENGFLARYGSTGDPVWAQGLNGRTKVNGMVVANNAVYACGAFREEPFTYAGDALTLAGTSDLFLLKSDLAGQAQWVVQQTADGGSSESALALAADASGKLVLAGNFNSAVVTFGAAQLVNTNGFDMFVVKTGDTDVGITTGPRTDPLLLYPNPGTGSFVIEGLDDIRWIEIVDARGAVVFATGVEARTQRIELQLTDPAPGIHHLRAFTGERQVVMKLVIH